MSEDRERKRAIVASDPSPDGCTFGQIAHEGDREGSPVGLEFVIRPPLEAEPCPGSGRSNAHG